MRFNGKDISSFWKAKALKYDTRYYTEFERQEVSYRGFVAASLNVPTVRKISVDILVKDRDKILLDKTIREMSDFFISSGEAKLFNDRNLTQYFIARCTDISIPTFSGVSAKFTVEFTCSDYRPYDFITDEPIGDDDTLLSNFTFNGKHCLDDMHCLFVRENFDLIPKVNRNVYDISGRSGTVIFNDYAPVISERSLSGTLYFLKSDGSTSLMTPEEIDERSHEVSSWLVNAGRKPIIFDSDLTRQIDAEFCETSEITYDKWANGSVKIKMTLQPFFYDVATKAMSGVFESNSSNWRNFSLSGIVSSVGYTTPLLISVTPDATIADLRIGYYDENDELKDILFKDMELENGQTLVINSSTYDAYIGDENALKYIQYGDFPVITPHGRKMIRFLTNTAVTLSVSVVFNTRWL